MSNTFTGDLCGMVMSGEQSELLQHPRRNLGNRYRTQAQKFARLAGMDETRFDENMAWAEQNARQAILHDFTDERNWRCLADLKIIHADESGLRALIEDVFSILGRDPEQVEQLKEVDFLMFGLELLEAAFTRDPLDPDSWWTMIESAGEDSIDGALEDFSTRCKRLDFRDQRANIVYGRRIERVRQSGREELFIELAKHLIAHRPQNHELWMQLGRLHERREEFDEAWSCYDHVQALLPHRPVRDEFLSRLTGAMDGAEKKPWSGPDIAKRDDFLAQMQSLTTRISTSNYEEQPIPVPQTEEETSEHPDLARLSALIEAGDANEAFFLARRLLASGEEWAQEWLDKAKEAL